MEQKDYIMRQIDELGKVLGQIATYLLGLKSGSVATIGINFVNQRLKSEIDLDLELLLSAEPDNLIDFLIIKKGLNEDNLDKLAEILCLIANDMTSDNPQRNSFYKRSLIIYEYIEKTQRYISFDRYLRIEEIKTLIQ